MPAAFAKELAELYAAGEDGLLRPRGDRRQTYSTPIEETLSQVIETTTGPDPSVRSPAIGA